MAKVALFQGFVLYTCSYLFKYCMIKINLE